jgi:hypothetical protein
MTLPGCHLDRHTTASAGLRGTRLERLGRGARSLAPLDGRPLGAGVATAS